MAPKESMSRVRFSGKENEPIMAQVFPTSLGSYDVAMDKKPRTFLAENLRRLMDYNNLSTHSLCRLSGLPQTTISRALRQESSMTVDALQPLANAFRIPIWMLLYPCLDPAVLPRIQDGEPIHTISAARLKQLLPSFDALTDSQQDAILKDLEQMAEANLMVVRKLGIRPALQQPQASYRPVQSLERLKPPRAQARRKNSKK